MYGDVARLHPLADELWLKINKHGEKLAVYIKKKIWKTARTTTTIDINTVCGKLNNGGGQKRNGKDRMKEFKFIGIHRKGDRKDVKCQTDEKYFRRSSNFMMSVDQSKTPIFGHETGLNFCRSK